MKSYRCRWCGYGFNQRGKNIPSKCPYCNESRGIEESFDSKKVVREVDDI